MKLQAVLEEALQLTPSERLVLIRGLSESLANGQEGIPSSVRRTTPATNLADYVADFWPEDESSDDLNQYIKQQRASDRLSDQ